MYYNHTNHALRLSNQASSALTARVGPPLATELCKAAADAGEHLQAAETADETQSHNLTKAVEPRGAAEVPSGRESRRQRRPQAYGEGPEPRGSGWFGGR